MYWPVVVEDAEPVTIRLTNTGAAAWPEDVVLVAGWAPTDEPYLARPPSLAPLDAPVPALGPGESVLLTVALPQPPAGGRAVAWVTLEAGGQVLSDLGAPALQIASGM
jgi:hypothetical protein